MKHRLVRVRWVDAAHVEGWHENGSVAWAPRKCESSGFVIARDKQGITLAQTVMDGADCDVISIPWECVKSVRRVS